MKLFDIETKPRIDLVQRFIKPYPPFAPDAVKYGNTKDPEKRAAILAAAEDAHIRDEEAYWLNAKERASLNPLTAEVVCVGLGDTEHEEVTIIQGDTEHGVLTEFWLRFMAHSSASESFVFWSGCGDPGNNFDADMLIRRSWLSGVRVPASVLNGRYLGNRMVDAAGRYLLGKREAYCGLSRAAEELGLFTPDSGIFPKSDSDPVQGVNFWQWWEGLMEGHSPEEQRKFAAKYLRNDVLTLRAIVGRIF